MPIRNQLEQEPANDRESAFGSSTGVPHDPPACRASVFAEIPALVALAIPVVAGLVGSTAPAAVDSFMLGPLGEIPLAAASITQSVLVIFYACLYGMISAAGVLIAQAHGSGDPARAGSFMKHGLVVGLASGLFGAAAMAAMLILLAHAGQPPDVMAAIPAYWYTMALSLVPFTLAMVMKQFLESIERPWTGAMLSSLPLLFCIPLNWLLIHGHWGFPRMGLEGAGLATLLAFSGGFAVMLIYVRISRSLQAYRGTGRIQRNVLAEFLREGLPMSLQYLAEATSVAIAGIFIGVIGATALAANQIVFSVGVIVYMAPLGMAGAVTIRIAQAIGGNQRLRLRAIGLAGILVVTLWMLVFTVLMINYGRPLSALFVSEPVIIEAAAAMFVAIGIMQVFDGLQSVSLGALRGMLDTRWPTRISLIAYWLVALPLSAVMGFSLDLGGPGIWAGFGLGLAVAGILLLGRFVAHTSRDHLG